MFDLDPSLALVLGPLPRDLDIYRDFLLATTRPGRTFVEKLREVLVLLSDYLLTEVAILSRIERPRYEIVESHSPGRELRPGQRFDFDHTFCEVTLKRRHIVHFHHAHRDPRWCHHPAYRDLKLEAYIGIPVMIDDKIFGTLNFSSFSPLEQPFSAHQEQIVTLASRWISNELVAIRDAERQRQALIATRQALDAARDHAHRTEQTTTAFLANVSHELRTPLNGILGLGHLLLQSHGMSSRQREWSELLQQSAQHLLTLIDDVLDLSRIEANKLELAPEPFSPYQLVEEVATLLAPLAHQKDLYLDICIDARVPDLIHADPLRLRQVLLNLIGNAVKFTERGGVFVHLFVSDHEPGQLSLCFEVEDSGVGIAPEELEQIFEPFARSKDPRTSRVGGSGLGLSVSRELVKMMGGELAVTSTRGEGSRFTFQITTRFEQEELLTAQPTMDVFLAISQQTLRDGLAQYCEKYGARCVARAELAQIILIDLEHDHLSDQLEALLPVTQSAQGPRLYGLRSAELQIDPTCYEGFDGFLDKPLKHKQFISLIRQHDLTIPVTSELSLATLSMEFSEPELEEYDLHEWLLPTQPFTLELALFEERETPSSFKRLELETAPQGAPILVVEDNPINARVTQEFLNRLGFRSLHVEHGQLALEACEAQRFGAILLDCQMPVLDGYQTANALRERERALPYRTPIIGLSADIMPASRRRALDAGMDEYLTKPLHIDALAHTLATYLPGSTWLAQRPLSAPIIRAPQLDEPGDMARARPGRVPSLAGLPQREPARLEVVDESVYAAFEESMQSKEFVRELLEEFFVHHAQTISRMQQLAQDVSQHSEVGRNAHKIRGSASLFGLEAIVARCTTIEELVRQPQGSSPDALSHQIDTLREHLNAAFSHFESRPLLASSTRAM